MGEPIRPRLEIYRDTCIACGACEQSCPTDVIYLDKEGKPYVRYPDDCEGCFLCEFDCPVDAIKVIVQRWLPTPNQ